MYFRYCYIFYLFFLVFFYSITNYLIYFALQWLTNIYSHIQGIFFLGLFIPYLSIYSFGVILSNIFCDKHLYMIDSLPELGSL